MIQSIEPGRNGTRPEPVEPDHISASTVKLYLTCSLRYYFRKVLQLPEPTSASLHLGSAVHRALQHFHKARWHGKSHDTVAVLEAYEQALSGHQEASGIVFESPQDQADLADTGKRVIEAYMASDHGAINEIPLGVEVHLEADLPDLPSPVVGYVDLVRTGNVPVDYKTCAATPNVELETFQHELQLTLYQMLIEDATDQPVEARELVFLVKTKTPKVIIHRVGPATKQTKQRALDMCMAALDGIYHERFHPQPGTHCTRCSYRAECAAWTEKGGAL